MVLCELLEHTNCQQGNLCSPSQQQLGSWRCRFLQDTLFEQNQRSRHERHTNNQHRNRSEPSCRYLDSSDRPHKEGTLPVLDMDCNHQERKVAPPRRLPQYNAQVQLLSQLVSARRGYRWALGNNSQPGRDRLELGCSSQRSTCLLGMEYSLMLWSFLYLGCRSLLGNE